MKDLIKFYKQTNFYIKEETQLEAMVDQFYKNYKISNKINNNIINKKEEIKNPMYFKNTHWGNEKVEEDDIFLGDKWKDVFISKQDIFDLKKYYDFFLQLLDDNDFKRHNKIEYWLEKIKMLLLYNSSSSILQNKDLQALIIEKQKILLDLEQFEKNVSLMVSTLKANYEQEFRDNLYYYKEVRQVMDYYANFMIDYNIYQQVLNDFQEGTIDENLYNEMSIGFFDQYKDIINSGNIEDIIEFNEDLYS
jgi:hypothetical protein